jgi:hypothetical protein
MSIRLVAAMGMVVFATHAFADVSDKQAKFNKRLNGQYTAVEHYSCVGSNSGFGPLPYLYVSGPISSSNGNTLSTINFLGDGTLTAEGTFTLVDPNPQPPPGYAITFPVITASFTCSGNYQVNADNTFTYTATCSGESIISSVGPGSPFTRSGLRYQGRIGAKGALLSISVPGAVETNTTPGGTGNAVCSRSVVAQPLKDRDDK